MFNYLSLEVIEEILKRLPVKSVVRCMCVCKAWKSIITDHVFIASHHHHLQSNPANSSLFFHLNPYDDDEDKISTVLNRHLYSLYSNDGATDSLSFFKFPPFDTSHACDSWTVVDTCNGLVCFADGFTFDQAVIWNPCILKYLILPKPLFSIDRNYDVYYGFGFDSQNYDFKVFRMVSHHDTETISQFEIYSLASHSWRNINVAALPFCITDPESKFVNGILHWMAYRTINEMHHYFILTFDFVEEKFGELMIPHCLKRGQVWRVLKGGNLLAFKQDYVYFPQYREFCRIWVMKEYSVVESWTQLFQFELTSPHMRYMSALRNNEEVVVQSSSDEITVLNPIKGLEKKIRHHIKGFISCVGGDHVESLFLINEKNAKTYLPL